MSEEELKRKIYERLGLEFESLSNEGGNDWVRARNEIIEENRQQEFEKLKDIKSIEYITINKDSDEFKIALNSDYLETYNLKVLISQRSDLEIGEIDKLITFKNKDIMINLTKFQKLSYEQIDKIIPESVYLTKKNLIENQILSKNQINILEELMNQSNLDYKDLIIRIKNI